MNERSPGVAAAAKRIACPWLPATEARLDASITRRHGGKRGGAFYCDALAYAQSLWLEGKPAQAILQLNKAWMAEEAGEGTVAPYRALVWLMKRAKDGEQGFLGNPVRHFQHLASRMSGPRKELRSWRAWACFHLAERALEAGFPRDGRQIAREGLWIPGWERVLGELGRRGWRGERAEAERAGGEIFATGEDQFPPARGRDITKQAPRAAPGS